MQKENISIENILIITDDINLPFGTIRIRGKGSDGGHNGLKDIQINCKIKNIQLRFGVGNGFQSGSQIDYVLGMWNEEELKNYQKRLKVISDAILSFIFRGINNYE